MGVYRRKPRSPKGKQCDSDALMGARSARRGLIRSPDATCCLLVVVDGGRKRWQHGGTWAGAGSRLSDCLVLVSLSSVMAVPSIRYRIQPLSALLVHNCSSLSTRRLVINATS